LEEVTATWKSPYKFNAKELDEESGLYYYGARYYDPQKSFFYGVDPMSDKYPNQSNYIYCSNNPIRLIDPNGMDEWELNSKGEIVKRIENKAEDSFHMVDDKGNRIEGKSQKFDYGTIQQLKPRKTYDPFTQKSKNVDIIKIKGDENSKNLFEFVAKNTSVEWSNTYTGKEGENGVDYLSTSHTTGYDLSMTPLLNNVLNNRNIRRSDHSHDNNTNIVSLSDVDLATKFPKATFNIYSPGNGKYTPFDKNSVPGLLPVFEVIDQKKK